MGDPKACIWDIDEEPVVLRRVRPTSSLRPTEQFCGLLFDHFDLHAGDPRAPKAEHVGCAGRDIDDAIANEGSAIDHDNRDAAPVAEVGDKQMCAKRQGAVGGGQAAMPGVSIVRRQADRARLRLRSHKKENHDPENRSVQCIDSCLVRHDHSGKPRATRLWCTDRAVAAFLRSVGADVCPGYRGGLSCRSSFIPKAGITFLVKGIG
jgi:hypothetical protein